jgi:ferric-dicitrate binding protein FerR (iron transport regulator)
MPEENIHIDELIVKHLQESLTDAEQQQLNRWVAASAANRLLFERLTEPNYINAELEKMDGYDDEKGWETIKRTVAFTKPPSTKKFNWTRVAAAAAIIILGTGSYFVYVNNINKKDGIAKLPQQSKDVKAPATVRAIITLANGEEVNLDSAAPGQLAIQGNVKLVKTADGKIVYTGGNSQLIYNTLVNPRGSKVQPLTLSDGTNVWLNSESSLKFPAAFAANERRVEITGEAYFEVAKNPSKKFIVSSNGVQTEVLGTHFNVNSYNDESSIKVTLLEGAVKVSKGTETTMLKPGQQADITTDIEIVKGINTDEVVAWKDGLFHFESADLKTILRQFARWYDIEVVYKGTVSSEKYFSIMNRNSSLSNVLKSLQASGIKFKIENKTLYIE